MESNEKTIAELIASLNNSIEEIHKNPTTIDRIPTNLEIMIRGTTEKGLSTLFSPKVDNIIFDLFEKIQNCDYNEIIKNKDKLKELCDIIFGKGSFQGPVSQEVLNNIKQTMTSYKYQTMKSFLGKSMATIKKTKLLIKNLEKNSKKFKNNPEEYEKYKEAVYAIKQVLKFAAIIYRNRELVNQKVLQGLNNIVHENCYVDMPLIGWGDL